MRIKILETIITDWNLKRGRVYEIDDSIGSNFIGLNYCEEAIEETGAIHIIPISGGVNISGSAGISVDSIIPDIPDLPLP